MLLLVGNENEDECANGLTFPNKILVRKFNTSTLGELGSHDLVGKIILRRNKMMRQSDCHE